MPQKLGMLFTYSNKRMAPPVALLKPNTYTIGTYTIGAKMARFNTSSTMQTIMRTPPGSCSSCGH